MKKYLLLLLLVIPFKVYAEDAKNLSKNSTYMINNMPTSKLNDENFKTYATIKQNQELKITSNEKISHIYIMFELSSKKGTITTENEEIELGMNNYLHEYQKLTIPTNTISLKFDEDVKIADIYVYSEGAVPSNIQIWETHDKADLMIFSTHADDEQLFFAGVMPTYINQGKSIHVVYLARHDVGGYYNPSRMHEQLNGLWALGVKDYPTFGLIPDAYSTSLEVAESQIKAAGFDDNDIIKFDVKEIRKYKPKVILGHDENGEYGHGQHRLNTYTLKQAILKAEDESYVVDDLKPVKIYKVYLHLYNPDNQTILDYDIPLEKYNGKTAYEVSKEGYKQHLSQQYTWFTNWLNGKNNSYTSAKQITKYNPMNWGLYYTSVGEDVNKNDLFENIPEEVSENKKENDKEIKKEKKNTYVKKKNTYINKFNMTISTIIVFLLFLIIILPKKKKR